MKLLKKVKVGGINYRVEFPYNFIEDDGLIGICDSQCGIIKVAGKKDNRKLCDGAVMETFLHEVLHAIDNVYCGNVLSEEVVTRLSIYIYCILKTNNLDLKSIPETINILGHDVEIKYPYEFENIINSVSYNYDTFTGVIKLADSVDGIKYENDIVQRNFITAVVDFLISIVCLKSEIAPEFNIRSFSSGLYQVLKDNKILVGE